jgi:hypothetical protein
MTATAVSAAIVHQIRNATTALVPVATRTLTSAARRTPNVLSPSRRGTIAAARPLHPFEQREAG